MASSILPSRSAPATAGANVRDCLRAALNAIQRSIITPMDHADCTNRITTTAFARKPICFHRETKSHPTAPPSWNQNASALALLMIWVERFSKNMSVPFLLRNSYYDWANDFFGPGPQHLYCRTGRLHAGAALGCCIRLHPGCCGGHRVENLWPPDSP